jgi:small subunit ribosomal protein S36
VSTVVAGDQPAPAGAGAAARELLRPEVRLRPWRVLRSVPAPVWLVTALFTLVLGSWSVLTPQYHAPDEPHHVDAVMRLAEGQGWPPVGHAVVSAETVGSIADAPYGSRAQPFVLAVGPFTSAEATARADRPAWRDTPKPGQHDPAGAVQQMMQHPPLYYLIGAGLLKLAPGAPQDLRFDLVIGILRLMSVLMVAPLPLLAWAAADRLTESRFAGRAAALVPLAIPMLTHIGSSVNNDALLVLTGGLTTVAICYVLRGDTSVRTASWLGLFLGAAMLTKSLGVVFVPLAVAAYLLAWRRARKARASAAPAAGGTEASLARTPPAGGDGAPFLLAEAANTPVVPIRAARLPWLPLLVGTLVTLAAGGWWFVVNLVRYHTFQPSTPGFTEGTKLADWGSFADLLVNGTIQRWWGDFGWLEAQVPVAAARAGTAAVAVLVAVGIAQARGAARRVDLLAMVWPTVGLFALMTLQSGLHFHKTYYVSGISGRYLFAGIAALAVAVGAGAASAGRLARFGPIAVLAAAVAMQAVAVHLLFRRWWTGPGGSVRTGVTNLLAWSPWPALAVEIVGVLCALALLATLAWSIVFAVRPVPRDPGERDEPRPSAAARTSSLADLVTAGLQAPAGEAGPAEGPRAGQNWFAPGRPGDDGGQDAAEHTVAIPRRPGSHRHRRA